ncbi:flagellar hook assembly protein FlgD [Benzoatithermus flavus]|uniref:Basal-body rod modification protein FlgD n=1 Tax=Benzoatithermus flavus TaxID=3108223 RepID=A0ABU8XPT1_9PROT
MTITTASSATTGTVAMAPTKGLAGNFDTFLKILTTQLRQQDPLSPMDATTFTSQLVQFASVEQAIQTNTKLGELTRLARASSTTSAMGLLGQEVSARADRLSLPAEGDVTIRYRLPKPAAEVTVSVLDAKGRVVGTVVGSRTAGENAVSWNGIAPDGQRLPAGEYDVRIAAKTADGSPLAAEQFLRGRVQAIERKDGDLQLRVADALVPLDTVSLVRQPGPSS